MGEYYDFWVKFGFKRCGNFLPPFQRYKAMPRATIGYEKRCGAYYGQPMIQSATHP